MSKGNTQLSFNFGTRVAPPSAIDLRRLPNGLSRDAGCQLCKLHKETKRVCTLGEGPAESEVMVIGEAPGMGHQATDLLEDTLSEYGFDLDKVYFTSAVSCKPDGGRAPTKGEVKACQAWLRYQISKVKPRYILLLGNTPLLSITGKVGITTKRGRPFEQNGIVYLPIFSPAFVLRDEEVHQPTFERDVQLFKDIVDRGAIPREDKLNSTIVRNRADFDRMLKALRGDVSFDIETTCLYPWQKYVQKVSKGEIIEVPEPAEITAIGFGTEQGEFTIPVSHVESPWTADAIAEMVEEITPRLRKCRVITHNGKFDMLWMMVFFGVTWYELMDFDTMLAHYMVDENSLHGLKLLAQKFCGAPDWDIDKNEKKAKDLPLQKLATYHAHDLYYTRALFPILRKKLRDDEEVDRVFREIMMPCARLFVEIEFDGVFIDVAKFDDAEKFLRDQYDTALENLKKWEPKPERDSKGRPIPFNWGSSQQLAALLFGKKEDGGLAIKPLDRTKGGAPSCSESVLKRIDHKSVGDLLKFREAKQQLSFFIDGWKPFLHRKRVKGQWYYFLHPSFKLHGTVTGRLSCEHPNLQQVPRDPRIRTLITAPPGWVLLECDLSQIELRVAAELARETAMIEAFVNGIDVHWLTAIREIERGAALKDLVLDTARTYKQDKSIRYAEAIEVLLEMGPDAATEINPEWKEYRKKAKAINFGYLYGMWWKKFKLYARDNYGVDVTDEQAEASRVAFFDLYARFPAWHTRQKKFARSHGFVRSLSGRKRRLPKAQLHEDSPERGAAERQGINAPVQSFANEINLMAAIQLRKEYGRDVVKMCGTVHDAILAMVRVDKAEEVTRRLLEIMTRPPLMDVFEIDMTVPIEAEAKLGPWGKGLSLEKWLKEQRLAA